MTEQPKAKRKPKAKKLTPAQIEKLELTVKQITDFCAGNPAVPLQSEVESTFKAKVTGSTENGRAEPEKPIKVEILGVKAQGRPTLDVALYNWCKAVRRTIAAQV